MWVLCFYMNKVVRICGNFSKPMGVHNHKSMGNTAIYCLILLKIIPFGLVSIFLITFSSTVLRCDTVRKVQELNSAVGNTVHICTSCLLGCDRGWGGKLV